MHICAYARPCSSGLFDDVSDWTRDNILMKERVIPTPITLHKRMLSELSDSSTSSSLETKSAGYAFITIQDKYTVISELGRGMEAIAYLARSRRSGDHVVVREFFTPLPRYAGGEDEDTSAEIQVVRELNEYVDEHLDDDENVDFVVVNYHQGETLQAIFDTRTLSSETLVWYFKGGLRALYRLHKKGITHGEPTPGNLVVNEATGEFHWIDFGMARLFASPDDKLFEVEDYARFFVTILDLSPHLRRKDFDAFIAYLMKQGLINL